MGGAHRPIRMRSRHAQRYGQMAEENQHDRNGARHIQVRIVGAWLGGKLGRSRVPRLIVTNSSKSKRRVLNDKRWRYDVRVVTNATVRRAFHIWGGVRKDLAI